VNGGAFNKGDTGSDNSGGNNPGFAGIEAKALDPGGDNGGGNGGFGGGVTDGTVGVAVTFEQSDKPLTVDASHDNGVIGNTEVGANADLSHATEAIPAAPALPGLPGAPGTPGAAGDSSSSALASASSSGGGGVEIGGFNGAYASDDLRARCVRVLRDPKKYTKRLWETCRGYVKKEQQQKKAPPQRSVTVGAGPG
jgi:hypothetical protein